MICPAGCYVAVRVGRFRLRAKRSRTGIHFARKRYSSATARTSIAMYPYNDTLGGRLRLYVEVNFHDA